MASTLTVKAASGAYLASASGSSACSVLRPTLDNFGLPLADAVGKAISFRMTTSLNWTSRAASVEVMIPSVTVAHTAVKVSSRLGGFDTRPVGYAGANAITVGLQDDFASTAMKLVLPGIDVLENDVGYAPTGALTLSATATSGCASRVAVNPTTGGAGTCVVGTNRTVNFTPTLKRLGKVTVYYRFGNSTVRGKLTVDIGNGVSQAIDDTGLNTVINRTPSTNVLLNDIIPNGIRPGSAQVVHGPFLVNGATLDAAPPGTAVAFSPLNGLLELVTLTAAINTLDYQWTDNNGQAPGFWRRERPGGPPFLESGCGGPSRLDAITFMLDNRGREFFQTRYRPQGNSLCEQCGRAPYSSPA
jgi:hypothetical protein